MKTLLLKKNLESMAVFLLVIIFGLFYWQTILTPPLFGDATIHGSNAHEILNGGWSKLSTDYPAFYYYLMVTFFSFFGEKGNNLVPYLGFIFLLLSTFLLIKHITKNYYLALLSIVLVGASPKLIYYSARMYQEILLTGLFVYSIYLLLKYFDEKISKILFLLLFFVGIALSTKQQGLYILYPSVALLVLINFVRKKVNPKQLFFVATIPFILGLPFYGVLFHTKGSLQPGSDEFGPFRTINSIGKDLFQYDSNKNQVNSKENLDFPPNDSLDSSLINIELSYGRTAFSRAESRHIWPFEVLTNVDKFNQAHSLYVNIFQGKKLEYPVLSFIFLIAIISGFIIVYIKNYLYRNLLLFTLFFLPINYVLFSRNSDQQRYHIFIPVFMLVFALLFINKIIANKFNKYVYILLTSLIIPLIFITVMVPRIQANQRWNTTQIYRSSKGGIFSIIEAGKWISTHSKNSSIISQPCGNEVAYYSNRKIAGDWRIYFLDSSDLKKYFQRNQVSYHLIYKSQIENDESWISPCWVPKSFYQRMEENYPKAYTTSYEDIYIYDTSKSLIN